MRLRSRPGCTPKNRNPARPPAIYIQTPMGDLTMPEANALLKMVTNRLDQEKFRQQHWEGSFHDYLEIVTKNPKVVRNSFQRVYDMILSYGFEKYTQVKQDLVKYHFFSDPIDNGGDAVFGLDKALERLVDIF